MNAEYLEGLIISVRHLKREFFPYMIRASLSHWEARVCRLLGRPAVSCWSSHNAIVVLERAGGRYGVGECLSRGTQFTPWLAYEKKLNAHECLVRFYKVKDTMVWDGQQAAKAWWKTVWGTPYDFMAFPKLLLKAVFFDISKTACGWTWANWCTEGVGKAWLAAGRDVYQTVNPTPLTNEQVAGECPQSDAKKVTLTRLSDDEAHNVRLALTRRF